jgi:hypothetical protein
MSASGLALNPRAFRPDTGISTTEERTKMKRLVFALFAVTLVALPICAQVGTTVKATIPFAFAAGNATLPAGNYVVGFGFSAAPFSATLVGPDRHTQILAGWPSGIRVETPTLIFHRYGNQYFLSEIRDWERSRVLKMSREELELQQDMAAASRSEVIVLARR